MQTEAYFTPGNIHSILTGTNDPFYFQMTVYWGCYSIAKSHHGHSVNPLTFACVYLLIAYMSFKKSFSYLLTLPLRPSREPKQKQQICHPLLCTFSSSWQKSCSGAVSHQVLYLKGALPAAWVLRGGLCTCRFPNTWECCIRNPNLCAVHSVALQTSIVFAAVYFQLFFKLLLLGITFCLYSFMGYLL